MSVFAQLALFITLIIGAITIAEWTGTTIDKLLEHWRARRERR